LAELKEMSGKQYLTLGTSLMGVKYVIDCLISGYWFHRPWIFSEYFAPGLALGASPISAADATFYTAMLLASLPFAFVGSALTLRRLKTLGLPPWMVVLFFTPFLNMVFFVILSVVDSRPSNKAAQIESTTQAQNLPAQSSASAVALPGQGTAVSLMNRLPADGRKAFFVAALLPVPISVLSALFSVSILGVYGWSVFTAIPFVAAIAAPILYGWHRRRTVWECVSNSIICLMLMASVLLLIPFEGIICLMMASPLAVGIGIVGGLVGYAIQANMPRHEDMPKLLGCFALFIPLLILGEFASPPTYPVYENVSLIEIAAPPSVVWKYLIDFPRLDPPSEFIFKTGIAYPIEAKIKGRGPGAIRECIFTTGKFIEPIQIWNEPKLLRFGVLVQPHPMHELSFYPDLNPPHLDHYLVAKEGQFLLTPTDSNHTTLQGTTWYQNYMGPSGYWRIWSDWIIHRIHMRVLNHVKHLAEQDFAANSVGTRAESAESAESSKNH